MENAGEPKPDENGETKLDQPTSTSAAKASPKPPSSPFVDDDKKPKSPFNPPTEPLDRDKTDEVGCNDNTPVPTIPPPLSPAAAAATTATPFSPAATAAVTSSSSSAPGSPAPSLEPPKEPVNFVVIHNKNKYDVEFPLDDTVAKLKLHLHNLIGVPETLQKVMFRGLAKDDKTLREIGVTAGAKVMVVGSKLDDVLAVSTPSSQAMAEEKAQAASSKEPLCKQKNHKKVLDRGVPDDVMPGILNTKEPLPPCPLSGMLNKSGGKVRLTFKLELDQLWIGTKERTDKIPMATIKSIVSEPIEGHAEYHVMGIQLGTTEASRYWVYWVPVQYIESIKEAVLGTWES